jgi:beta-N-acetylhexosaminidase
VASRAALAFAAGLTAAGILPVYKHFPGLGGATANTDVRPASTAPYASLRSGGLVPFVRAVAAGASAIMVSNASVPGLSSIPSSLSPTVIGTLLRHDLGYRGLVITDSLSVPSVTPVGGSLAHTVTESLKAGADMILFNAPAASTAATTRGLISAIVTAVLRGTLPLPRLVTAVGRVLTAKHALPDCPA